MKYDDLKLSEQLFLKRHTNRINVVYHYGLIKITLMSSAIWSLVVGLSTLIFSGTIDVYVTIGIFVIMSLIMYFTNKYRMNRYFSIIDKIDKNDPFLNEIPVTSLEDETTQSQISEDEEQ